MLDNDGWLINKKGSKIAYIGKLKEKENDMCFGYGNSNHNKTEEVELVFCTNCEYWKFEVQPERPSCDRCFHPDICNRRKWVKPNPIRNGYWNEWIESGNCFRLNSNNNCKLFKKKEYPDRTEG